MSSAFKQQQQLSKYYHIMYMYICRCSYHTKGKPNARCIKKKYNVYYIRIIPTAANDLSTLNITFFHDYENLCLATQCQCRNNYMLGVCGLEQLRSQYIFTRTVVPSVSIVIDKYTGWTKKKWDLKNNGNNSAKIQQKGKKLVCFGKFCINAAG